MKFGISAVALGERFAQDTGAYFCMAKNYGYDILEVMLHDVSIVDPSDIRRAKEESGLDVTFVGLFGLNKPGIPVRDFSSEDPKEREAALIYTKEAIRFAHEIGALCINGPFFAPVGKIDMDLTKEKQRAEFCRVAECLRECADYAKELGIPFGLEPVNRYESNLVCTTEDAVRLIDAVGPDCKMGLLLDTYHMNIEECDIQKGVEDAGQRLLEIHACGIGRGVPGKDHFDWDALVRGCRKIGFDGNVVIESFSVDAGFPRGGMKLWRPHAKSNEEIAVEGLKFLKHKYGID